MNRREFFSMSLALSAMALEGQASAQTLSPKVAVVIGVDEAGSLPKLEATDGGIYAVALSEDLTSVKREPVLLFTASSAPWVGSITAHHVTGYVTDAPYIHRLDDGTLIMLWSSFDKQGMYAIGQAYSTSGEITGPWLHEPMPLNSDDGGHAMLFKDLNGKLKIAYHAPNSKNWRVSIKGVTLQGKKLIPGN